MPARTSMCRMLPESNLSRILNRRQTWSLSMKSPSLARSSSGRGPSSESNFTSFSVVGAGLKTGSDWEHGSVWRIALCAWIAGWSRRKASNSFGSPRSANGTPPSHGLVGWLRLLADSRTAISATGGPQGLLCSAKWLILLWRRGGDSNPRYSFRPYDGLANRCFRPLSHLSGDEIGLQKHSTIPRWDSWERSAVQ
jgi:hypothetical protein